MSTSKKLTSIVLPIISQRSIIDTLASNACGCIQTDISKALADLSGKATKAASKLTDAITGPLNNPITLINNTVLQAQNTFATGFESQLKGAVQDLVDSTVGTSLNTSCFLQPFADFKSQVDANIDFLGGLIQGMDFRIPTLNLNFQIAMAVNICGAADTFSGPLATILGSAGLGTNGSFDIAGAFAGMIFPTTSYEEMFKQTIGSVVNVGNMQNMMDSVISSINDRVSSITGTVEAGVDAVKNWGTETARTVNDLAATISDPSKAIAEITNKIPIPGAVVWAAQFGGLFGFNAPVIGGGGSPKRPRDVNYLTDKAQGQRINTLLSLHDLHASDVASFMGIDDSISGFHGLSDIGTDDGLGRQLKNVMSMKDSPLSNAEYARQVKSVASDMSIEGMAAAEQRTLPEAIQHINTTIPSELQASLDRSQINIDSIQRNYNAATAISNELTARVGSTTDPLIPEEVILLARADKTASDALTLIIKAQAEQVRLQNAINALPSTSPALPGGSDERLSDLYRRPVEEPRYSTFTRVPGTEGRQEQVVDTDSTQLGQTLATNAAGRSTADVAFAARLNAASGRTPEENAEADRNFEARLNERRGTLPPSNDTRLSSLTPTPVADSTLGARASSQPGSDVVLTNTSRTQPSNDTSGFGRREQGFIPGPGQTAPQPSSEFISQELPPAAPGRREGGFRPPTPASLQENPGSREAQALRETLPNSDTALTQRSAAAVDKVATTPPVWLKSFNENFDNQ